MSRVPKEPLLLETVRIEDGEALHLEYHNERVNRSREKLFVSTDKLELNHYLSPPKRGVYRCRILYGEGIEKIEYLTYTEREISRIMLLESDVAYSLKYADRKVFDDMLVSHPQADDLLIVQKGYLTDTTIANVAFYKKKLGWITPDKPLLEGTTRHRLIKEGLLTPSPIRKEDLFHFDGFALMNAMIGFKVINPTWLGI